MNDYEHRLRIHLIRIRIQHFRSRDPVDQDPGTPLIRIRISGDEDSAGTDLGNCLLMTCM